MPSASPLRYRGGAVQCSHGPVPALATVFWVISGREHPLHPALVPSIYSTPLGRSVGRVIIVALLSYPYLSFWPPRAASELPALGE